jgi:sugar lactone lactonase YvrE
MMQTKKTATHRLPGFAMGMVAPLFVVCGASAQNLFIGNQGSHSVIEISTNGQQSTIDTGFVYPNSIAFDRAGDLYVADQYAGNIFIYPPDGSPPLLLARGINNPMGIAFDRHGNLYVGTQDDNILEFAPGKRKPTVFATGIHLPITLAFDSAGNLFVACLADDVPGAGYVTEITPDGHTRNFASGFNAPDGLAFNAAGDLFVSSGNGGAIAEITPTGTSILFAPGLNAPVGLAFDGKGNLFVADAGFNNQSGDLTEFYANGGQNVTTPISKPLSLAFQGIVLPVGEPTAPTSPKTSGSAPELVITPVPRITSFKLTGATLKITAINGAAGKPYVLLASTNLLLPPNQWTPLLTNSFDEGGNLNLSTNIPNPNASQEFFRLETP